MKNIVKIDLCKSKIFAAAREISNPDIRQEVLNKLLKVSIDIFPAGGDPYPKGSYYKADGDATYFLLDKPSVALRSAIEFMQTWYHVVLSDYPECRVIIDQGLVKDIDAPGKPELISKAFENISIFEKDLGDGQIYVTRPVTQDLDRTMVNFSFFRRYDLPNKEQLEVYSANYLDPRTFADSSLLHALFVANPKASEARDRVIELFLIEYALEKGDIIALDDVRSWGLSKNYSIPDERHLRKILSSSLIFNTQKQDKNDVFVLTEDRKISIKKLQAEFYASRATCVDTVTKAIHREVASNATDGVDMGSLIEDYLCAIFSEIRMMANYFRHNHEIFQESKEKFAKFDYILKRALPQLGHKEFEYWKTGFLAGLKEEAQVNNPFIAAVFHNVLATYYLNRSTQVGPYQIEKLKKREIYLDTNVLYAFMVSASGYNEIINYIIKKLDGIGLNPKVFPFTLEEYEQSLESVERQCPRNKPLLQLQDKNPALLQEFLCNASKYQGSISVCRRLHSITKGLPIVVNNYKKIEDKLKNHKLKLETNFSTYTEEEVQELWIDFRNLMPSDAWDASKYWNFIYSDSERAESVKAHDVHCIQNLIEKTCGECEDELGMQTLFLTLDIRRLLRLRKKYPFVLTPEQFLEFFLPYLFLADVPLIEAKSFPNLLLSAGLGTLLVSRPPVAVEMLRGFLENPSLLESPSEFISETGREMATALNSDRFREIVQLSMQLPDEKRSEVAQQIAEILENERKAERETYYKGQQDWRSRLKEKNREIDKLRRTVRYWRSQARGK